MHSWQDRSLKLVAQLKLFIAPFRPVRFHASLLLTAAVALFLAADILDVRLSLSTTGLLLGFKAGLVGLITSAILLFYKSFWDDVVASERLRHYPALVRSYLDFFRFLFPTNFLVFGSIGADFYLLAVDSRDTYAMSISLGAFGAALLGLLLFTAQFAYRVFNEMYVLERVGQIAQQGQPPSPDEQHEEPSPD